VEPTVPLGFVGETVMDFNIAAVTARAVDPLIPPLAADVVVL